MINKNAFHNRIMVPGILSDDDFRITIQPPLSPQIAMQRNIFETITICHVIMDLYFRPGQVLPTGCICARSTPRWTWRTRETWWTKWPWSQFWTIILLCQNFIAGVKRDTASWRHECKHYHLHNSNSELRRKRTLSLSLSWGQQVPNPIPTPKPKLFFIDSVPSW